MKKGLKFNKSILLIIVLIATIALAGCIYGCYYMFDRQKVLSVITLDINPSISMGLNKNEVVVKIMSLNDDAKKIIKEKDLVNNKIEDALTTLNDSLVEHGYIKDKDNVILINVDGNISSDKTSKYIEEKVSNTISQTLKEKEIECNVIVQELTSSSKENSNKYGISSSKASYIESIISENSDVTFEELKDKTISEINSYIKDNDNKNNDDSEKTTSSDNDSSIQNPTDKPNSSKPSSSTNKYYTTPPALDAPISEWCIFNNAKHPQTFSYKYENEISLTDAADAAYAYIGLDRLETLSALSLPKEDNRSTYCRAIEVKILTDENKYILLVDSVTKRIISNNKEIISLKLSKTDAINILLNYFNVTLEDTTNAWAVLSFVNEPGGDVYNYNTNLQMKDGTDHIANIDANTGKIIWLIR